MAEGEGSAQSFHEGESAWRTTISSAHTCTHTYIQRIYGSEAAEIKLCGSSGVGDGRPGILISFLSEKKEKRAPATVGLPHSPPRLKATETREDFERERKEGRRDGERERRKLYWVTAKCSDRRPHHHRPSVLSTERRARLGNIVLTGFGTAL